jgi:hypothetical protein
MLTIKFSPVRSDAGQLTASLSGKVLTVDGVDYDLNLVPDGASVQHEVLHGLTRTGDDFELTLILPHGAKAPEATRFPQPIEVMTDGDIDVPIFDVVEPIVEDLV